MAPHNQKNKWPSRHVLVLTGLLLSMSHLHTYTHAERQTVTCIQPPQRLLLSDMSHEQSPQLALRGFRTETWSSGAKNNIRQVCCPAVAGLGNCGTEEIRVCVLTWVLLLIRSPAMFSPTSGYYVMFVSVTPWLIRLFLHRAKPIWLTLVGTDTGIEKKQTQTLMNLVFICCEIPPIQHKNLVFISGRWVC